MKAFLQRHTLSLYILMTYTFSWAFLYPCYRILLNAPEGKFPWLALIGLPGAYGPSLVALFMTGLLEGRIGVRDLLKKLLSWRVKWIWYVFLLLVPVGIEAAAVLLASLRSGMPEPLDPLRGLMNFFPLILLALPFGPLGEELGWRGFLLPRLLEKHSPLVSGLILGFIWGFWHIASFSYPGAAIPTIFSVNSTTILFYLATITGESLFFTFFFFKTRGSVLLAVLLHAVFNASTNIVLSVFPTIADSPGSRMTVYVLNLVLLLGIGSWLLWREQVKKAGTFSGEKKPDSLQ